jgi:hypothetical protein
MRAIAEDEFGGPVALMTLPIPEIGAGEVLIRVRAAGVNPFDWKVADGVLKDEKEHRFPLILGFDVVAAERRRRHAIVEQRLLVGLREFIACRFEEEIDARAVLVLDGEEPRAVNGNVQVLLESEHFSIEFFGLGLIVDHHARDVDADHDWLPLLER